MSMLPTISSYPTKSVKLPLSGITVKYRPFLVREEKALLMLRETPNANEMDLLDAMMQILRDCTMGKLDPEKIPLADIEFLFLRIRAISKGEKSVLTYKCENIVETEKKDVYGECGGIIPIVVNLEEIEVVTPPGHKLEYAVTGTDIKIFLRYPRVTLLHDLAEHSEIGPEEELELLLLDSIESIAFGEEIYTDIDRDSKKKFLGELSGKVFEEIREGFINQTPILTKKVDVECPKCGHKETITLKGIRDFF